MTTDKTEPIITAAGDHAEARRDVLADIAASLSPDQLASAALDLVVVAREDLARSTEGADGLRAEVDRLAALLTSAEDADAKAGRLAALAPGDARRRAEEDRRAARPTAAADSGHASAAQADRAPAS